MGDSRVVLLESNSNCIIFVIVINITTASIMITNFNIGIVYFADSFLHKCCLSGKRSSSNTQIILTLIFKLWWSQNPCICFFVLSTLFSCMSCELSSPSCSRLYDSNFVTFLQPVCLLFLLRAALGQLFMEV
jgi:hypothetical protein